MPTPPTAGRSVTVTLSARSKLVNRMQEITLRAALNRAIELVSDCFDDCNRRAEPGSTYSEQARACEDNYAEFDGHQTTLTYTKNLAGNLVHNGLDHLLGATNAALDAGSPGRWSSLSLTRSLIEASVACLWLVDPAINLDTRLRRTNQMFVRASDEMLRLLPGEGETTPRFLSIDPIAKATCLKARDDALKWAIAQGWTCSNGKSITRKRWIMEIPSHKELVAFVARESPEYWKDVYGMLSGAAHSQPLLMTLSISEEPDVLLGRALMVLDIGISFYTRALRNFAEFMGWSDHDIDSWFGPVHATLEHMQSPDENPLPVRKVDVQGCAVCPAYQDPSLHRIALMSHVYALLERNCDREHTGDTDAPTRYSLAIEFINDYQQMLMNANDADPQTHDLSTALGIAHMKVLTLFGCDQNELLASIAASWAVLRSPSYQSSIGTIQGWMSRTDDQSPAIPYGND